MKRPVVLIIRDGWGSSDNVAGNAVAGAATPVTDALKAAYPWTMLECSGEAVGLPEGYQGSSEVGHLNMGAGRVVVQELKRIDDGLSTGELFEGDAWSSLVGNWKTKASCLHLLGLLQDEGVHAHQEHLFKIMRRARAEFPAGRIVLHPFLDGRDTPPRSTREYLAKLLQVMEEVGGCVIGTVMGRYYSMDRSQQWALTDVAFDCLVEAQGRRADSAMVAVEEAYANDHTPEGTEMVDEYILPTCIGDYDGIKDGDCVFHTNYRQDRAIQLTQAFIDADYPGSRARVPEVTYLGFTRYFDEFTQYLMGPMGGAGGMEGLLGEVVSKAGMRQLRIAETQKFRHVTSFFNGKSTTPFEGEDQVDVPGRFDPSAFGSHPEMEAYNLTDELLRRLEDNPYELIVVNYANGDMVGHTGDYAAAKKAIEVVDECLGRLLARCKELDAQVLITADHGNSEEMVDVATGLVKTSHTLNPVECILVSSTAAQLTLVESGKLADLAPTILQLLELEVPAQMTAQSLIAE